MKYASQPSAISANLAVPAASHLAHQGSVHLQSRQMRAQIAGCACAEGAADGADGGKSSGSDQICNQGPIRGLVRESQPWARSAEPDACPGVITKPRTHKTPAISALFAQTRHPFPSVHQIGNQGPTRESVHESQPWARSTGSGVHRGIIQNPGTARLPVVRCMEAARQHHRARTTS